MNWKIGRMAFPGKYFGNAKPGFWRKPVGLIISKPANFARKEMTANLSTDILKSALIELAQSDRAFFVSFIADLTTEIATKPDQSAGFRRKKTKNSSVNGNRQTVKITPPYRRNVEEMRSRYAMDKAVLLQLQTLFSDAPTAEEFLQLTNA